MAKRSDRVVEGKQNHKGSTARSLVVARRGIATASDFKQAMVGLMFDVLDRRVTPEMSNAVCYAGKNMLKVVELEQKFAVANANKRLPSLTA